MSGMRAIISVVVAVASADISLAFENFKTKYGVTYNSTEEHATRLSIFANNLEKVNALNAEHVLVSGEAVFGITQFSDLTEQEMRSRHLTARIPADIDIVDRVQLAGVVPIVAGGVDWRGKDVLTAVKNQGRCGSCWAFSATEAIESFAKLSGKFGLETLSPQQIVSCDKTDLGCNGGWPYDAYKYVIGAGGIEQDSDYPYTSGSGGVTGTCEAQAQDFKVKVAGYKNVAQGEDNLAAALTLGPVSVCVDASQWSAYSGGVLSTCSRSVDHCVQAVGYTDSYWIVRNSWGTSWGEQGFIRIARGSDLCLIGDYVTYPTF